MSAEVEIYRFSVEEFNKLGEAGIFDEDDRVELLDGEIIVMSPIGSEHAATVLRMGWFFQQQLGTRALTSTQNPTVIDEFSELQPDIMLLKMKADFYRTAHPQPADILLLVEVSDTTLAYDRGPKLRKYAECAVPEVWMVNLKEQTIEQFRTPSSFSYLDSRVHQRSDTIRVAAFPETEFRVADLIG